MKKERKVGIEILRILSMYMVLILHYKLHQNVSSLTDINYKIANFVDILCVCAVNCYVLISGYFLSKGETSIKKLIKTLSPVWFYSITILIVNLLLTEDVIKYNNLLKFIFPVTLGEYWFVLSYTLLYLLTPFLKKVIDNSERKELKSLIIIFELVNKK
jgi:surface polysaccharide O-acyltransferase-like enzyme